MMQPSKTAFRNRSGATLAGMFGAAAVSALLLCGAGNTPTGNIQTGDMNAAGHAITNAANVATTNLNVSTLAALPANTTVGGTNLGSAAFSAATNFAPALGSPNYSPRAATLVIAASDSVNKAGADVVCTGTADQTAINAAIATLTNGGEVFFRTGTYTLTAPVVVDEDWVTLQGESKPHWNKYNNAYPTHAVVGTPGGAKFLCTTSGQAAITIGTTTANMHGDTRHHGIALRDLYLVGDSYTGTGIYDTGATDVSEIRDCAIQCFNNGIVISWDSPVIEDNSIQDDAGLGIDQEGSGHGGFISHNLVFDLGATGIRADAYAAMISDNIVGDMASGDGIDVRNVGCTVTGNTVEGIPAGYGIVLYANGSQAPNDNTITGNYVALTGIDVPNKTANTAQAGISIGALDSSPAYTGNTVTGNTVVNTATSSTGYAIECTGSCAGNTISGNTIVGPAWNANSGHTIKYGTGNYGQGSNAGDNSPLATLTVAGASSLDGGNFVTDGAGDVTMGGSVRSTYFEGGAGTGNYLLFASGAGSTGLTGRLNTSNALLFLEPNSGQTGDLLDFENSSGSVLADVDINGNFIAPGLTIGGGTKITEVKMGAGAALTAGAGTISDAAITTTSSIIVTHLGTGTTANFGALLAYPTSAGNATVKSASSSDNDTFTYIVVNH